MSKGTRKNTSKPKEVIQNNEIPYPEIMDGNERRPQHNTDEPLAQDESSILHDKTTGTDLGDVDIVQSASSEKDFDFNKKIYLQIHAGNIYHIFGSAIIVPSKYIENRAFADPQSYVADALVLSNGCIRQLGEDDVLIELNIPPSQKDVMYVDGPLAYTQVPMPVSRIKSIHVSSAEKWRKINYTSRSEDGGLISDALIHRSFPEGIEILHTLPSPRLESEDYTRKIRKFDRILGAFAYLKNFSWLMVNRTGSLSLIPSHFYYMANAIKAHPDFRQQSDADAEAFYQQMFDITQPSSNAIVSWITARLQIEKNFTDADTKDFFSRYMSFVRDPEARSVGESVYKKLIDSIQRKRAIPSICESNLYGKNQLYIFAILRQFANADNDERCISRKALPELLTLDSNIGQYAFACLGYFYGYRLLRNYEEEFKVNDQTIASLGNLTSPMSMKFDLSTLFDYTLIEAVYHISFFPNATSAAIHEESYPSLRKQEIPKYATNLPTYDVTQGILLGRYICIVRHRTPLVEALDAVQALIGDVPVVSDLGVYLLRNGIKTSSIDFMFLLQNPDKWRYMVNFKKQHIIDALREDKIDANEVMNRIGVSRKHKEF